MAEPARVKVEYAYKVNLGDYENIEIRVGVEASARDGESIEQAYKRIDDFVSSKVAHEVAEAKAGRVN